MTDGEALLAAIRANPRDDLPRLVFADWLQEQGEVAYAEFIRLSCRIASESLTAAERKRLRSERFARFQQMREDHPDAFRDTHITVNDYCRGIGPESVSLAAESFLHMAPHWGLVIAPSTVTLYDPDECPDALNSPQLSRIDHLRLLSSYSAVDFGGREVWDRRAMRPAVLRWVAESTKLERLSTLEIDAVIASVVGLAALRQSPLLDRLEGMRIRLWADGESRVLRVETGRDRGAGPYTTAIASAIEFLSEG
jgi:uncharacterized protein (TIGR02996 family)